MLTKEQFILLSENLEQAIVHVEVRIVAIATCYTHVVPHVRCDDMYTHRLTELSNLSVFLCASVLVINFLGSYSESGHLESDFSTQSISSLHKAMRICKLTENFIQYAVMSQHLRTVQKPSFL